MGNKNEGYLGGIMGGASRVLSGATTTVTTGTQKTVQDLTLQSDLSLVGDKVDKGATNGFCDAYFSVSSGSGYQYLEVRYNADSTSRKWSVLGLIKAANVETGTYGNDANSYVVRMDNSTLRRGAAGTTTATSTANNSLDYIFGLLLNRATGDVYISVCDPGSAPVWIRGDNTENTTFDGANPTFSGLDLATFDTLYAQINYNETYMNFNFGGNPLFDAEETSGNDSSTWYNDPPVSVVSFGRNLEEVALKVANTGILSLEEAGTQTVGGPIDSNTQSVITTDFTDANSGYTMTSDTRVTKSGSLWDYLKYDISSFSSGYIYGEMLVSAANSSYTAFGVGDGTAHSGVYGGTTSTASIRSRANNELSINTFPLSATSSSQIASAFTSYPLVFSLLIDCATKDVWIAFSSEDGSDRKWLTGATTTTSTFDINTPFVSGFTGLAEIGVQTQSNGQYADINFGTDGTFGGATSSNESASWFFDPPAEVAGSVAKTLPQLSWGGITGRSVLTEGSGGYVPGDDNWNDVTLLLDGENATIADVSSASTALTVGSSVSQNTSVYKYGSGSLRFTHTSDSNANTYISVHTGPTLSGDYTVEFWWRPDSSLGATTAEMLWECRAGATTYPLLWVYHNTTTAAPMLEFYAESGPRIQSTATLTANTWYHVALVRSSGTYTMYIDGVSQGTWANSSTINSATHYIGRRFEAYNSNYYGLNGYLDDFRLTPGVARYTSNFTPPTESFPTNAPSGTPGDDNWNDVTLLLDGDNNLIDRSGSGHTMSWHTSSAYQSVGKFGQALDLTSTHVEGPANNADFQFGTDDFTIESWIYWPAPAYEDKCLFDTRTTDGDSGIVWFFLGNTTNGITQRVYHNGSLEAVSTSNPLSPTTWHHVALVRSGNTFTYYTDGQAAGTFTDTRAINQTNSPFYIGHRNDQNSSYRFGGYVDNFRITKGVARYTSNFTPPTESFPTSLPATPDTLVNTGIFTLEEIYELTKSA